MRLGTDEHRLDDRRAHRESAVARQDQKVAQRLQPPAHVGQAHQQLVALVIHHVATAVVHALRVVEHRRRARKGGSVEVLEAKQCEQIDHVSGSLRPVAHRLAAPAHRGGIHLSGAGIDVRPRRDRRRNPPDRVRAGSRRARPV